MWTDAMINEMTTLTGQGLSTAKVAAMLGVTRNAVIGKAHRIKLRLNDKGEMVRANLTPQMRIDQRERLRMRKLAGEMRREKVVRFKSTPKITAATPRRDKRVHAKPGRICFLLGMR